MFHFEKTSRVGVYAVKHLPTQTQGMIVLTSFGISLFDGIEKVTTREEVGPDFEAYLNMVFGA